MYDAQHYVDLSEATEDIEELRNIIATLADIAEDKADEVESCRVDPSRNRDLAQAVLAFAEWQNSGYEGDSRTRETITRALWQEVATHVYGITEVHCPDVPARHPARVDACTV